MQNRQSLNLIIALGLFFLSIGFLVGASHHIAPQASLDAAYYHIMADRLESGKGFNEPIVWHHLNNYSSVEHPMDYWMPLGIIFYYCSRLVAGVDGQVWLNIILWSFLAVFVYSEVLKQTGKLFASVAASLVLIFCGRNLFYLLTTDNIAFYATFGFAFFKVLADKRCRWYLSALVGGMITLMRIEGSIFAALAGLIETIKARKIAVLCGYLMIFLLVLSPWLIRNYQVLNTAWPASSKALFLQNYEDFFSEHFPGTFTYYSQLGINEIVRQKMKGLADSFLNLIAVPGLFVFYPFWLAGLIFLWQKDGKYFAFFLSVFWLLCGLLFTHQTARGTAMHISAFFLPHYAILFGAGLHLAEEKTSLKGRALRGVVMVILIWAMLFSIGSVLRLKNEYKEKIQPYERLFAQLKIPQEQSAVSAEPVFVHLLGGCGSVVSAARNSQDVIAMAERFACDYIILDQRVDLFLLPESNTWQIIASISPLVAYQRHKEIEK